MDRLQRGLREWGWELTPAQREQFEWYYRELVEWNKRFNLTKITDYEEVQVRHFLDSLSALQVMGAPEEARIIDVGSGPGFPGLPIKIVLPQVHLVLLDSVGKKTHFLEHICGVLGLPDVEVIKERAEVLAHNPAYRETFDWALARAVDKLPSLVEVLLPFCRPGGAAIAYKGPEVAEELGEAENAIATMGGSIREVREFYLDGSERSLVVIDKSTPTPARYPRRPGLPRKRPTR
ncbi:MAG: 16S rRNA (guanine(527)-N(7))-methyltransferase RsmG [Chloroflexi bacterium]|nr:16S rRNA (guanine(527)-N(7))-methyltransferase RsmG [Chloroflexota bacterium]